MNFYTSDNHWGHVNIIKFCARPFPDLHTMNVEMTRRWNSVVSPKDTVYHLGDFSWGNPKHYSGSLNGKKVLILGNHDKESQCRGHFDEIVQYKQVQIDGRLVHLKHYPFKQDRNFFDRKFADRMLDDDGNWLIHGHVHNSQPKLNNKSINVSVEWWNYTPVSEEQVIQIMRDYDEGQTKR